MKKLIILCLASVSLFGITGCSKQGNEKPATIKNNQTYSAKQSSSNKETTTSSTVKQLTPEEKEQKDLEKRLQSNLEKPDKKADEEIQQQAVQTSESIQADISNMQTISDGGGLDVGSISSKHFNSTYDHVNEWITYARLGWSVNQDSIHTTQTSKQGVYQYQLALAKDGQNMAYFVGYMNVYPKETGVQPQFTIQNVYLTSSGKAEYKAAADADPR